MNFDSRMGAKEGPFKRYIVTKVNSYGVDGHKEARNRNWRLDKFPGQGRMRKDFQGYRVEIGGMG